MKVCIRGLSPSKDEAPRDGYETWGMAWDAYAPQYDRVFEMHAPGWTVSADRLRDCAKVYVQYPIEGMPEAIVYPFDEVAKITGPYWCSSIAYMLALAIYEGADEIALFGVDGTEQYAYQHPNINFLLGLAMGRGIKIHLPEDCPLLRFVSDPDFAYQGRYGRLNGGNH